MLSHGNICLSSLRNGIVRGCYVEEEFRFRTESSALGVAAGAMEIVIMMKKVAVIPPKSPMRQQQRLVKTMRRGGAMSLSPRRREPLFLLGYGFAHVF